MVKFIDEGQLFAQHVQNIDHKSFKLFVLDFGQQKVISMTKPIREEAITNLYCSTLPRSLAIADLVCSSGPNTWFVVSEFIKEVDKLRQKLGHELPEYQEFLNDLPGNDFNTIFKSLPSFQKKMSYQLGSGAGPCLFSGTPGSFYGRLFPSNSMHFVHSSYNLHRLSQVTYFLKTKKIDVINYIHYHVK